MVRLRGRIRGHGHFDGFHAVHTGDIRLAPRIHRRDEDLNYWFSFPNGTPGASGPLGPDSEIYYDLHPEMGEVVRNLPLEEMEAKGVGVGYDERYLEIWNLVFMQSELSEVRTKVDLDIRGHLPHKTIDTGMGDINLDLRALTLESARINAGTGAVTIKLPDTGKFDVDIDSGMGTVVIEVPAGMGVRLQTETAIVGRNLPAGYMQNNNRYTYRNPVSHLHSLDSSSVSFFSFLFSKNLAPLHTP